VTDPKRQFHIATQNEGHLHAALKDWCAQPGDRFEVPLDGYQIDIVRDDVLIEIQTKSFGSIRRKLTKLIETHKVRLVHPVVRHKWIVRLDDKGEPISRRKSANVGAPIDAFEELVYLKDLLTHKNLSFVLVMTDEEEVRRYEAGRVWRRKGWVIVERRLVDVAGHQTFETPEDFITMLPADLPEPFTTHELAALLYVPRSLAQKVAYALAQLGAIEAVGRHGNAICYMRAGGKSS